jgi:hypothetical protein
MRFWRRCFRQRGAGRVSITEPLRCPALPSQILRRHVDRVFPGRYLHGTVFVLMADPQVESDIRRLVHFIAICCRGRQSLISTRASPVQESYVADVPD